MMFLVSWVASALGVTQVGATVVAAGTREAAQQKLTAWLLETEQYDSAEIVDIDRIHNPNVHGVLATVGKIT